MFLTAAALIGLAAALFAGGRRLKKWEIRGRGPRLILAAGGAIVFIAGTYLMGLYGYHILKIVRYWILMYALILLALLDWKKRIVPNRVLLVLLGIRTILMIADSICFPSAVLEIVISSAAGMAGGGLMFFLAAMLSRGGIGMGDVKLIAVMGYYLGFQVLMSDLILTLVLTVVAGVFALAFRRVSLHTELPFAPFAAVGTILTILLGC